jgi:hypothetical protein
MAMRLMVLLVVIVMMMLLTMPTMTRSVPSRYVAC